MKKNKIIYRTSTIIMSLVFAFSAGMYFLNYERVSGFFDNLGFPIWIIYPLAILKIFGLIAIWTWKNNMLKEWAYAGFFFDATLAFFAHYMVADGEWQLSIIAIIAIIISRIYEDKVFPGRRYQNKVANIN